jgi:hypothetical protein
VSLTRCYYHDFKLCAESKERTTGTVYEFYETFFQENNANNDEQRETVMRVEISQGERQLNPINRAEAKPARRAWLPSFNFGR